MADTPLVSVIVPTFNRCNTLPATIQSVIDQTYSNWELLIVDDGSTDHTEKTAREYTIKDQRVKYLSYGTNKGPSAARNHGIKNSTGAYIAFLDSDDTWSNNHLYASIKALQDEPGGLVCFSLWWEKDNTGALHKLLELPEEKARFDRAMRELNPVIHDNRILFSAPAFFALTNMKTIHICHINTLVLHREVIKSVGMLNEKLWVSEDIDFIYRILHDYSFCLILDYHLIYNNGEENVYNFLDRHDINLEVIMRDERIIRKFTFCGSHLITSLKERIAFIKRTAKIANKIPYIQRFTGKIEIKYFTLAYLNKNLHRFKALRFLLKSSAYKCTNKKIKLFLHILFPRVCKTPGITLDDLWLH